MERLSERAPEPRLLFLFSWLDRFRGVNTTTLRDDAISVVPANHTSEENLIMTNRTHTATNAHTEFDDPMARLDELHRIRIAKYGLSSENVPDLLRKLASSYEEGCPLMELQDERMTLIYLGMKEARNATQVTKELIAAKEIIAQLYSDVSRLNNELNAIHQYCDRIESEIFYEDYLDEDGSSLVVDVPVNDNQR